VSQQINLYNPIFRKQRKVLSAVAMLQALGILSAAVAVMYFYMGSQSQLLELRAADSSRQLKGELERLGLLSGGQSPEDKAKALAERRKELEASLAQQGLALQGLGAATVGNAGGYSQSLRALARLSMEGVWLTHIEFAENGGELSLTGRAVSADLIPVYLGRLRSDPALRQQPFATLEITRQAGVAAPGAPRPAPYVEFVLSSRDRGAGK
jgi:Fimbrial assembly protein (PilN)